MTDSDDLARLLREHHVLAARVAGLEDALREARRALDAHRNAIATLPRLQQDARDALAALAVMPVQASRVDRIDADLREMRKMLEEAAKKAHDGEVVVSRTTAYAVGAAAALSAVLSVVGTAAKYLQG
jgi:hypothetical protein